jgi:methylmalonyl-CoA/ethylmalonyl-CoA epimerase
MVKKIDHIGIAVENLDNAVAFWRDSLGLPLQGIEEIPARGLKIAFFKVGEVLVELLAPLTPDSEIGKFLEKRGPGMHHLALESSTLSDDVVDLKSKGVRMLSEKPSLGAEGFPIIFMHPKDSACGVLLELIEK